MGQRDGRGGIRGRGRWEEGEEVWVEGGQGEWREEGEKGVGKQKEREDGLRDRTSGRSEIGDDRVDGRTRRREVE